MPRQAAIWPNKSCQFTRTIQPARGHVSRRAPAELRRAVLAFLVKNQALWDELRGRMLSWRYSGFSAHHEVRAAAEDAERRKKLAG
jgi:hypothetical protein